MDGGIIYMRHSMLREFQVDHSATDVAMYVRSAFGGLCSTRRTRRNDLRSFVLRILV